MRSFRKTEIKPILFFEPINDRRPGVFHQSRTGCCQKTRDFELHRHTLAWSGEMSTPTRVPTVRDTCQDRQRHVAGPLQCNQ